MDKFQHSLREFFDQKKMTQKEVARRAGTTNGYLNVLLHGKKKGSEGVRKRIAEACGLQYGEMIGAVPKSPDMPEGITRPLPMCQAAVARLLTLRPQIAANCVLVPLVAVEAVIAGSWGDGEVMGWAVAYRPRHPEALVAAMVAEAPAPCWPSRPAVAVVDTADRETEAGQLYLLRPPARYILAGVQKKSGLWIVSGCQGGASPVQALNADQFPDLVVGRVVRIFYDLE
jgi:transcriptional regulator with XRE-family HTH domain